MSASSAAVSDRESNPATASAASTESSAVTLLGAAFALARHWKLLLAAPLLAGAVGLGASYLITPVFTARTSLLVPQQQPNGAAAALATLGGLSALTGGAPLSRSVPDQYVSLMQSETVLDRLVDRFDLLNHYGKKLRRDGRASLAANSRIAVGKKDGLITVEVDDPSPQRAAAMASQYVEELRHVTASLALTEAQQRRVFFEEQLKKSRDDLAQAQRNLQASGFTPGALRTEPRAAAEEYARTKGEVTAAEVRLQTLRQRLTDGAAEVQQAAATLAALRGQLNRLETVAAASGRADAGPAEDYVGRYREFKYQEGLNEMFARQYELARLDESRDAALIQVVDPALVPEWKSRPRRALIAIGSALAGLATALVLLLAKLAWRNASRDPEFVRRLSTKTPSSPS